jgi:hypothetical protein
MKRSMINHMCNTMHSSMNKSERFLFWVIASWGTYITYMGIQFYWSI